MVKNALIILISISFIQSSSTGFKIINDLNVTPTLKASLVNKANESFNPEEPFVITYGLYSLKGVDHNYNDYFRNIHISYSTKDNAFTIEAPYLVYENEDNRYATSKVTNDTTEEVSYEGNYDLWELTYNTQPYLSSLIVKGYWGDNYVRDIQYRLEGNVMDSTHYYLQNLKVIPTSSLANINNLRFILNDYNFSSDVYLSISHEERTYYRPAKKDTLTKSIRKSVYLRPMASTTFETKITVPDGFNVLGSKVTSNELAGNFGMGGLATITSLGNNQYTLSVNYIHMVSTTYNGTATITFTTTINMPAGDVTGPFTIETPISSVITTSEGLANIEMDEHVDFYSRYFLDTINCSGSGSQSDKEMVISKWDEVEETFLALPEVNRNRIILGEDVDLSEMLIRYDYCVFFKNYPINDFLNRKNAVNRNYSTSFTTSIIKNDNASIIIIILMSVMSISLTSILIFLLKKKRINQEEEYRD